MTAPILNRIEAPAVNVNIERLLIRIRRGEKGMIAVLVNTPVVSIHAADPTAEGQHLHLRGVGVLLHSVAAMKTSKLFS